MVPEGYAACKAHEAKALLVGEPARLKQYFKKGMILMNILTDY